MSVAGGVQETPSQRSPGNLLPGVGTACLSSPWRAGGTPVPLVRLRVEGDGGDSLGGSLCGQGSPHRRTNRIFSFQLLSEFSRRGRAGRGSGGFLNGVE